MGNGITLFRIPHMFLFMYCQKRIIYQWEYVRHLLPGSVFFFCIFFQLKDFYQVSMFVFLFNPFCEILEKGPNVLCNTFFWGCCTDLVVPLFQSGIIQFVTHPLHPFFWKDVTMCDECLFKSVTGKEAVTKSFYFVTFIRLHYTGL